uniref:Uncharacterized protein n=1 Tax=Vitis vinifera TaxID=29760 RepID=A5AT15_VITVI|nr:hypothetical protein VITISV_003869 [Vitis vinifera]
MTPEMVIRRPMVTEPPIEGNLDCKARPFHSKLFFYTATFRLQPELRDSFQLLQRYHMEHLMTPRDFFYPRVALDFYQSMTTHHVWDPTVIHFTIDGRHEIFTLDKWTSMTAYGAELGAPTGLEHPEIPYPEQPNEQQPVEIPADMRAPTPTVPSIEPIPEVTPSAPPATPGTPPTLTTSQSILTQQMTTLRAHQEQIIATQTQHTAILRQIQHHLGILLTSEHAIPILLEPTNPSQAPPLIEQTMPPEEPTIGETKASIPSIPTSTVEPSSPHDPPTTIGSFA